MAKITTRAAGLGACAALLGGLAAGAPATASATARPAAARGASARLGLAATGGWTRYRVPVKGQANLVAVAAPGRADAWAGGFTIHVSSGATRDAAGGVNFRAARGGVDGRTTPGSSSCPTIGFLDTLLLHWNGRAWSRVHATDVGRINYLSAAGTSSAWASGDCGLLGWNGRSWRLTSFPMPAASLQPSAGDVVDVSPGDAWLLGSTYDVTQNAGGGFVDHWNGRNWQRVTLPASLALGGNYTLSAIDAQGPRDVWIAGTAFPGAPSSLRTKVILLHWNGRTWRRLPQPGSGLGFQSFLNGVRILSASDVWIVGSDKLGPDESQRRLPLALHWNGRRWTTTRMPAGRGELYSAAQERAARNSAGPAGGQLLAVGDTFSPDQTSYALDILRWTGRAWVHVALPASGPGSLPGIAAIPGGGFWVTGSVGDNTGETGDTKVLPLIARRA